MLNCNDDKKTVYNLVYDKAKAKKLCEDCDREFAKHYSEYLLEAKKDSKKYGALLVLLIAVAASLIIGIICGIIILPTVLTAAIAVVAALVIIASLAIILLIAGIKEDVKSQGKDFENNVRDYEYPVAGKVYKAVGNGEITSLEIKNGRGYRSYTCDDCVVNYITEDGKPGSLRFSMDVVESFDISEVEVDLEAEVIRRPIRIDEKNFKIVSGSHTGEARK